MALTDRSSFVLMSIVLASLVLAGVASLNVDAGWAKYDPDSGPPDRYSAVAINLVVYASGLLKPTDLASTGIPGDGRLFASEQRGTIRLIAPGGVLVSVPFLDIQDRVGATGSEQGLLGLVFDPNHQENGYFYVNYTDDAGDTVISRFRVRNDDPDLADRDSERVLIQVSQPFTNHNAGDLAFGPDGYLYIPLGDGGSAGDPQNRSQNLSTLLGKILRVDVGKRVKPLVGEVSRVYLPYFSGPGVPYIVPADNPYFADGNPETLAEIWGSGLRNPWRISFDRLTGDLYIGDVGQDVWEEIDFQPAASQGGENYGWRCYEGNHEFNLSGCGPPGDYTFPVSEYNHTFGCSVTGGAVYRGVQFPALAGIYFFADYCSNHFWSLEPDGGGGWQTSLLGVFSAGNPSTFGESVDGEMYVAGHSNGIIYHIQAAP